MPVDEVLIPDPILDDRAEMDRIAARIHRSGSPELSDAELIIAYGESLKAMIEDVGQVGEPLLPELTDWRPAQANHVLLREIERTFTETLFRFNQLPDKVRIALLRLLGVTLQPAVAATTTLQFTKTGDFLNVEVIIPAGVEVATEDRRVRVSTNEELVIAAGVLSGTAAAAATEEGDIGRLPVNTLGRLLESVPGISIVTNTTPLTGGADAETVEQGKIRAREAMRIGEHLGSSEDWIDHIYFHVLRRKGRVTAFEGYRSNFTFAGVGYELLVVQGVDGLAPSQGTLDAVAAVINQRHVAGISVAVRGPIYKPFDVTASVKIAPGQTPQTLINKAKSNLAARFSPLGFEYGPEAGGRFIEVSDIVGQIEDAGPQQISVRRTDNVFDVTITTGGEDFSSDVPLGIGEMPELVAVTLLVS